MGSTCSAIMPLWPISSRSERCLAASCFRILGSPPPRSPLQVSVSCTSCTFAPLWLINSTRSSASGTSACHACTISRRRRCGLLLVRIPSLRFPYCVLSLARWKMNKLIRGADMTARLVISFVPERWRPAASFTVCGTIGSRLEERSRERRARRWVRMTSADVLGFVAYVVFGSVAIVAFLDDGGLKEPLDWTWMLSPGPVVRLARAVLSIGVPVVYMLWPPSVEEGWGRHQREDKEGDFLVQGKDGVRRPRKGGIAQGKGNGVYWAMGLIGEMIVLCFFWCRL